MRAINHAVTGAAIGLVVGIPEIAVPLALISHYVCDTLPHYGETRPKVEEVSGKPFLVLLVLDACLCTLLVGLLVAARPTHWLLAAVCAFVAASPDMLSLRRFIDLNHGIVKKRNAYERFSLGIQWFERPIGAVVEVAWFAAMVTIIATFWKR